jgi:preprotein translocase subunit SecE
MAETTVKKENFFVKTSKNISKFFRDVKSEIKKIVWPTSKTVFNNTGVVLVTIIVIGLFIFGLDTLLMNLLGLIMNIAK